MLVIEGVSGILSVDAQTIFTTPSLKSVACLKTPADENESFSWVATTEETSAVVLFCGSADAAVKTIPDAPVVIAALKVERVIDGELL